MTDNREWTITVTVPAHLPFEQRDALFTAVADAAHDWEPELRNGWDVDVSASFPSGANHPAEVLALPEPVRL